MSERPRVPTGHRPYDMGDPHVERVLAITMAVASEVAVLREHYDTLARVASETPSFTLADLEAYRPDAAVRAERDAWRSAYLDRILRIMHEAIPADPATAGVDYKAFMAELAQP